MGDWTMQEMEAVQGTPGLFRVTVPLSGASDSFQVLRNQDWSQVFYPDDSYGEATVVGPGDYENLFWTLEGRRGQKFTIDFQRTIQPGDDKGSVTCTWREA